MKQEPQQDPLAELLSSPLDRPARAEPSEPRPAGRRLGPRWDVVAALAAGAIAVLVGYALAGTGTTESTVPPTTAEAAVSPAAEFPPGYTPVDEATAVRVERIAEVGDDVAVTLISVVGRGLDPGLSTPFTGGAWTAVLADGRTVPARGQVSDTADGGVVTVLFPQSETNGEELAALVLTERWIHRTVVVEQQLSVDGLPWELADVAVVDLGDGVELLVDRLELGTESGVAEWTISGRNELATVSLTVELNDGAFDRTPRAMVPLAVVDRFFFDLGLAAPSGTARLSGPTAGSSDVIVDGLARWTVRLTVSVPTDATVPVPREAGS